jgi:hypothetical protein
MTMVLEIGQALQLLYALGRLLQLDAHTLKSEFFVHINKECAEVIAFIVGRSELAAWLGDYCAKQHFERSPPKPI